MPATDVERLIVTLEANVKKYEMGLSRAMGVTNKRAKEIESRFMKMNRNMTSDFMGFGKNLAAGLAAVGGASAFTDLIDAATRTQNALKVAGLSGAELTRVYDQLFASAQRNSAPVETLATLYSKLATVQSELGVSQSEMLQFTDKVAVALRVAGTDAQTASGALLQLSQALGSGVVRAEEFNSILEGALPIAQSAARGIKEAGGSVSKLRQLVVDGKVSNQAFFRGFLAGSKELESQAASSVSTVAQAFTRLRNALQDAAGGLDKTTGASALAVTQIGSLATYVTDLSKAFGTLAEGPIGAAISKLGEINQLVGLLLPQINALKNLPGNLQSVGDFVKTVGPDYGSMTRQRADLQRQLDRLKTDGAAEFDQSFIDATGGPLKDQLRALDQKLALLYGHDTRLPISPKATTTSAGGTVSIADFPATGTKTGGAAKLDEFAKSLEATNKQTAAINAETAAQAKLNPLINDYGYAVALAAKQHELLTAAQEAGKKVTPQLAAGIDATATSYAAATAAAAKLAEQQQNVRESVDFAKDGVNGALSDMRTALEDGKLTWEDLGNVAVNVLNKIADRLQTMLVDQLFAKGFGGLFGALPGLGGAVVGGVSGAGAVAKMAAPAAVAKLAAVPRMPSIRPMAANDNLKVSVSVDDDGKIAAFVRRANGQVLAATEAARKKYVKGEMTKDVNRQVRNPRRTG